MEEARDLNQRLLSVEQQIELLKSQGLSFVDEDLAQGVLNHVSLFRLNCYLHPLRLSDEGNFKSGSTFEQSLMLYDFDSALRRIVCSALERIEVSIRRQLSGVVTSYTNDPFWFVEPSNFRRNYSVNVLTDTLRREFERNDDNFIIEFSRRYASTLPPIWVIVEVSSFGTLSKLYKNIRSVRVRRNIANYYGISGTIMESWLHAMVCVRNICAHYNRLWNRNLHISSEIPRQPRLPFLNITPRTDRIYYVMSIILYFLQTVEPHNTFADKIKTLLTEYPKVDVRAMGFPDGWESEPLWH